VWQPPDSTNATAPADVIEKNHVNGHPDLGWIGVWIGGAPSPELARGLDELGYGAIWIGGSQGGGL
jgi:hypothetical protein